mmetsp:Transcript_7287/g.17769  ORF Transcript_7287/g.17769 Transcript_7287/m.17769 type:complete len:92 (+) Transcript_7287:716-991(+)
MDLRAIQIISKFKTAERKCTTQNTTKFNETAALSIKACRLTELMQGIPMIQFLIKHRIIQKRCLAERIIPSLAMGYNHDYSYTLKWLLNDQ